MKYCLVILFILSFGLVHAQEIQWGRDLADAFRDSRESGQPVLIDFWADWCEPCKVMESKFWKSPQVKNFASKFIFVRLDFDKATQAVRKYHVVAVPTVVFTDSWGNYLTRVVGFNGPDSHLNVLKLVPANYKPMDASYEALSKNDGDLGALRSVARFYYDSGAYEFSNMFYDKASGFASSPAERMEIMVSMGWNHLKMKNYDEAEKIFKDCLKSRDLASRDVALFGIVVSSLGQRKRKEAEKAFEELTRSYPDSPATGQARRLLQNP